MLVVPTELKNRYTVYLRRKGIDRGAIGFYQKWLRFYLDFCHKYGHNPRMQVSLDAFLKKLREKRQTSAQRKQAVEAVNGYYALEGIGGRVSEYSLSRKAEQKEVVISPVVREGERGYHRQNGREGRVSPEVHKAGGQWDGGQRAGVVVEEGGEALNSHIFITGQLWPA